MRDRSVLIERLYRERFAHFERLARAVTGDRESALDAVQEGFADAGSRR
jgi:DNA-directed RNA polymerase specialized sigma24 family protein